MRTFIAVLFACLLAGCQTFGGAERERSVVELVGKVDAASLPAPVPLEGEVDVKACFQEFEYPEAETGDGEDLGCFFFRGNHCWVSIGANCPPININIFSPRVAPPGESAF